VTGVFFASFLFITFLDQLYLHQNNLTGIMPFSICSKRGVGDFKLEVLTADCYEDGGVPMVVCTCCTECY